MNNAISIRNQRFEISAQVRRYTEGYLQNKLNESTTVPDPGSVDFQYNVWEYSGFIFCSEDVPEELLEEINGMIAFHGKRFIEGLEYRHLLQEAKAEEAEAELLQNDPYAYYGVSRSEF